MSETFPAWLGLERIVLRPVTGIALARQRNRRLVAARDGDAVWAGSLVTEELSAERFADLDGFLSAVVEQNLRIDFVHPRFALPRAYTSGSWPLLADPEVTDVPDRFTLTVSGLEAGMTLKRGDRLSILQTGLPPCYRALSADVTVASAIAEDLPVVPRLPIGAIAVGALARFEAPYVRLAIVPDAVQGEEAYRPNPVTIEVEEDGL